MTEVTIVLRLEGGTPDLGRKTTQFCPHVSIDALQEYMLVACQSKTGGLRDKPSKYVTCFCFFPLDLHGFEECLIIVNTLISSALGRLTTIIHATA